MNAPLYIGAMSGTSADSIDVVLVDFSANPPRVVAHYEAPLAADIQREIVALSSGAQDSLAAALVLDRSMAYAIADAVHALIAAAQIDHTQVTAIGSHGQTLRHQTETDLPRRFSCQIGDPNTLAELTGIDVVADFRRRDIAAGGEAAPLAPGFHHAYFGHPDQARAIVNIGGFCNATLLAPGKEPLGFDTGPGNCLLDGWSLRHLGEPFDRNGLWASGGQVDSTLLNQMKAHPYFARPIPKSTGRESFNLAWLDALPATGATKPQNVQSTLMQLTVDSLVAGLTATGAPVEAIYLCGGGARNPELIARLEQASGSRIDTTEALGIDPKQVEGCAFAWLARQRMEGLPGNLASVTGARGPRILGGIYRA